jgi:hypothetical protein
MTTVTISIIILVSSIMIAVVFVLIPLHFMHHTMIMMMIHLRVVQLRSAKLNFQAKELTPDPQTVGLRTGKK